MGKAPKIRVPAPPPPDPSEVRAKKLTAASQEVAILQAGFDIEEDAQGNIKLVQRAPTAEELTAQSEDKKLQDRILAFLDEKPGLFEITPETRELVEKEFGATREAGRRDIARLFERGLEETGITESRTLEDLRRQEERELGTIPERILEDLRRQEERGFETIERGGIEAAGSRGLNLTDTPISSELARERRFLGEDLARVRERLGKDVLFGQKEKTDEVFHPPA